MSQNKELETIKRRIHALTQKTIGTGCTEAEAVSAMEKVGELLEQYNLTMADVDIRHEPCTTDYCLVVGTKKADGMQYIATSLAEFCDLRVWSSRATISRPVFGYGIFGMEADIQAFKYLFDLIRKAMISGSNEYKRSMGAQTYRGQKKVAQGNFQRSFASRVSYRLREIKHAKDAELAAQRAGGNSLMVLKGQIVEQEWAKEGMKLRTIKRYYTTQHDYSAGSAGYTAGDKVNLNRPIGSQNANKLALR